MTSPIRTSLVIACDASFTPLLIAVCEWQSMMPGVTCMSLPSIDDRAGGRFRARADARDLPGGDEQIGVLECALRAGGPNGGAADRGPRAPDQAARCGQTRRRDMSPEMSSG